MCTQHRRCHHPQRAQTSTGAGRQSRSRCKERGEQHAGVQRRGTRQQGHAGISNNLQISTSVISTPLSSPLTSTNSVVEVIYQEAGFLRLFQLQTAPNSRQPAQITSVTTIWIIKSGPPHIVISLFVTPQLNIAMPPPKNSYNLSLATTLTAST